MTRTGKIARLPLAIRSQLNKNLADGVPGVRLVAWLNTLPEVQQLLTEQFDGREINEVNLTEWKGGGFVDWQLQQELLAGTAEMVEVAAALKAGTEGALAEHLSVVLAARYAQWLAGWDGEMDEACSRKLRGLRMLGQQVAAMRREDLRAERLEQQKKQYEGMMRTTELKALEQCLAHSKQWPEADDAFRKAFALLRAYQGGKKQNWPYVARKREREQAKLKRENERREREQKKRYQKEEAKRAAEEKKRLEQEAEMAARKASWLAAHPGEDPVAGKWWEWQSVIADEQPGTGGEAREAGDGGEKKGPILADETPPKSPENEQN